MAQLQLPSHARVCSCRVWGEFAQGEGVTARGAGALSPAERGRAGVSWRGGCSCGAPVTHLEAAVLLLCR